MTPFQRICLVLRVTTEFGIVVAFGWWGYVTGGSTGGSIVLAIAAPAVAFGFWGLVDFRWAGRVGEPLRLCQELAVSLLAAVAWYAAGRHGLAWALAGMSLVYHLLVYATGERLLSQPAESGRHVSSAA
jgi:Protein of unknown function (DUF2568)